MGNVPGKFPTFNSGMIPIHGICFYNIDVCSISFTTSDVNRHRGGAVPVTGEDVVIEGKQVLLNVQPPELGSISLQNGGRLVWGDVDGLLPPGAVMF